MSEPIIVAIIGAVGLVLAAVATPIAKALLPTRLSTRIEQKERRDLADSMASIAVSSDDDIFKRKLWVALGFCEILIGLGFYQFTNVEHGSETQVIAMWYYLVFFLPFSGYFFWILLRAYFQFALWTGALTTFVVFFSFTYFVLVTRMNGDLGLYWTTSFLVLLVAQFVAVRHDCLILRRAHPEFWEARTF
jgi:hypothetical protein